MFSLLKQIALPSTVNKLLEKSREYLTVLGNILIPNLCLGCEKKTPSRHLCLDCQEKIVFLHPPLCQYCAQPLKGKTTAICGHCSKKSHPPYNNLVSATAYKEPTVRLIQLFKYKQHDYLAEFLSSLMVKHLSKIKFSITGYDFMTSVPLHKYKLKIRGYNQTELLGRLLSNHFRIPYRNDIISCINAGLSQTKLSKGKRENNVKGIFIAKTTLKNRKIILIDDIFTTGATVRSCCQALREKGASVITVMTLSKT